ncbi:hypothetical protein ACU686_31455 [Yinghuangia aomiensis]
MADDEKNLDGPPATSSSSGAAGSPIRSYVAIGDSFTEGVGDPGPDGTLIG